MKKYLWFIISVLLIGLNACGKDEEKTKKDIERVGMDTSSYTLEDEIVYVNIFNSAQQYIEDQISKGNNANNLLRMETIYGNIDLLSLKQEVINRFNDVSHKNDANRTLYVSEPIFKAVGNVNPQHTDYIDALIFHGIFNPQIKSPTDDNISKEIAALGAKIAVTRTDVPYWFKSIRKCVDKKIDTSKITAAGDVPENCFDIINKCSADYVTIIENETKAIDAGLIKKNESK